MRETSNTLISCNGSPCPDAAPNDLRKAGLPAVVHAPVLTVADAILFPAGNEAGEGGMPAIRIPFGLDGSRLTRVAVDAVAWQQVRV